MQQKTKKGKKTNFTKKKIVIKLLYHPKSFEATSLVLVNTVSFKN